MREDIVFKGSRDGLLLVMNGAVEFENIVEQLKVKLEAAVNFFNTGTIVQLPAADLKALTDAQQTELINLFANYGITLREAVESKAEPEELMPVQPPLVVCKTLRGGQEIIHNGSVVIMGDVNPGARIIAGGDIVVHGACRGIVHAGCYGDIQASITADLLLAAQIRIASLIARAPDHLDRPERIETAKVIDNVIMIGPANQ